MIGGFAIIVIIGCVVLLVIHCTKKDAYICYINRQHAEDEKTHNYNDEYQNKLLNADYSQLKEFYGQSVYDYALEHYGSKDLMCQRAAVYSIVRELMHGLGYDYRPQVDTWESRMYNQKNGYYVLQPKDTFYGL